MTFINQQIRKISNDTTTPDYQTTTSTYQYLSGSRVTYTPENNSTFVYYQFFFQQTTANTDDNLMHMKLVSGSSVSDIDSSPNDVDGSYANIGDNYIYSRKTCLYRKLIPSWQGEKVIQINFRHANSNYISDLHRIDAWDGSTGLTNNCNNFVLVSSIF